MVLTSNTVKFDDDEQIPDAPLGKVPKPIIAGKTKLEIIKTDFAPLEKSNFNVMLKLTGSGDVEDRAGLDLVLVLDFSQSMKGRNVTKMKTAVQFLIKKLGPRDRLSVVVFAGFGSRIFRLSQMTGDTPASIEELVGITPLRECSNIIDGLKLGQQVLNERRFPKGRVAAIMLMSDGKDTVNPRPNGVLDVPSSKVPVYTFGLGKDQDAEVLKDIAVKSRGGTFSYVQDVDKLTSAVSHCLAGLLTTVVQDLELTIKPLRSTFQEVLVGDYYPPKVDADGSVTISLGDLYIKETRTVTVVLVLPAVKKRTGLDILQIGYTYNCFVGEDPFVANPLTIGIIRIRTTSVNLQEENEILIESDRRRIMKVIKQAIAMADDDDLEGARAILEQAKLSLQNVVYQPNESSEMLKYEMKQLLRLMIDQDSYETQGRPFALSWLISHDRQRFTPRGDLNKMRLFATPRMKDYYEQAISFDKDSSKPPQAEKEDVEQELAADPFARIQGPFAYFQASAFQSIKDNNTNVNKLKKVEDFENILEKLDKGIAPLQQMRQAAINFLLGQLRAVQTNSGAAAAQSL